jgi:hypothetical protein
MPTKINLSDYNLTKAEAQAYVEFGLWLQQHPKGGVFQYHDFKVTVTKK